MHLIMSASLCFLTNEFGEGNFKTADHLDWHDYCSMCLARFMVRIREIQKMCALFKKGMYLKLQIEDEIHSASWTVMRESGFGLF